MTDLPPIDFADDPSSPEFEVWRVDDARQSYLDAIEAIRRAHQDATVQRSLFGPHRKKDDGQAAMDLAGAVTSPQR